jgi:acyl-coenzyme A synthetase/AMP-(fatty) acid ligase
LPEQALDGLVAGDCGTMATMSPGILETLHAAALRSPQAPALLHGAQVVSHGQLQTLVAVSARGLGEHGVRGGETVGLCMEQTPLHCVALLALLRLGALVAPFSPRLPEAGRARLASRYALDRVLSDHDGGGIAGLPGLRLDRISTGPADAAADPGALPPAQTPARLALTSGTTGEPRAVLHSHGELLRRALRTTEGWDEGARLLPPRLHLTVASAATLGTLCRGGAVVFPEGPGFADLAAAVRRHAVTHLVLSPAAALALAATLPEGGLPGLRQLRLVGGKATPEQLEILYTHCTAQLHQSYALTELGLVAEADPALLRADPYCSGRTCGWARLEVVDEQGQAVPPGTGGEIRLRGDPMPRGYYRDEGHGGGGAARFSDGWLYTGDLGSLSAEGLLRVDGRRDELLNIGGHKLLPQPLEQRLLRSPLLREAAVFSLAGADGAECLAAALVPAPGAAAPELLRLCREVLGLDDRRVLLLEGLPRNELGKLRRGELRRLAALHRP